MVNFIYATAANTIKRERRNVAIVKVIKNYQAETFLKNKGFSLHAKSRFLLKQRIFCIYRMVTWSVMVALIDSPTFFHPTSICVFYENLCTLDYKAGVHVS